LRFTGSFDVASLPPQRLGDGQPAVDFRLGVGTSYREYLHDDEDVKDLRALDLEADGRATFNPRGLAYFKVFEQFARLQQPRNSEGPFQITRDRNRLGAELGVRPGGGTIVTALGYEYDFEIYEEALESESVGDPPRPAEVGNPDSTWHVLTGSAKWRFLPKTAAILDASYSLYDKDNATLSGTGLPAYQDSTALRIQGGLIGLLTPKLTTTLKVGWGRANYDGEDDFRGVIGQAALQWRPSDLTRLSLGYERDFSDSVAANFFVDHRLYAALEQRIAGRWTLSVEPSARFRRYRSYREQFDPGDRELADDRDDTLAELRLGLSFHVSPWLLVGGAYGLETTASGWRGGEGDYVKHVVLLRVEGAF
jgi:hypothetical protein